MAPGPDYSFTEIYLAGGWLIGAFIVVTILQLVTLALAVFAWVKVRGTARPKAQVLVRP